MNIKTLTIRIPEDLHDEIEELSNKTILSKNQTIIVLLESAVRRIREDDEDSFVINYVRD